MHSLNREPDSALPRAPRNLSCSYLDGGFQKTYVEGENHDINSAAISNLPDVRILSASDLFSNSLIWKERAETYCDSGLDETQQVLCEDEETLHFLLSTIWHKPVGRILPSRAQLICLSSPRILETTQR